MYCAATLKRTVEEHDDYSLAEQAIHELLAEWRQQVVNARRKKTEPSAGLMKAIQVVAFIVETPVAECGD